MIFQIGATNWFFSSIRFGQSAILRLYEIKRTLVVMSNGWITICNRGLTHSLPKPARLLRYSRPSSYVLVTLGREMLGPRSAHSDCALRRARMKHLRQDQPTRT